MEISATLVKELREKTGAGFMDCKSALKEAEGDLEKAVGILRKRDIVKSEKKAQRIAVEGRIHSYIHAGGKLGVIVEVNCETDFAAQTDEFADLIKNIAMHIAAADPQYIRQDDIPPERIEAEREIFREQALASGKPEKVVDKIVDGKLKKHFAEECLYDQPYIRDDKITISQFIQSKIATIGENINIRRFVRYKLGEGLEKKETDFAQEVQAQVQGE
ncbi:translation elongation factor Ts [Acidobacteriota bacterium]